MCSPAASTFCDAWTKPSGFRCNTAPIKRYNACDPTCRPRVSPSSLNKHLRHGTMPGSQACVARLDSWKGAPMLYVFGEYVLDTDHRELRRAGVPVKLEPKAYQILTHLVQHRDRLVPKAELLAQVWPDV